MSGDLQHWRQTTDDAGVLWLTLDVANRSVNTLSAAVLEELDALLNDIVTAPPAAVVIQSAKPAGFIAGADIDAFESIGSTDEAEKLIRRGQGVISRLPRIPVPTIALIHGHCLGGGLELALACDYRLAIDEPATRLALPEVKLGIHPGFGGAVRGVRIAGSIRALPLMLTGRSLSARQARKLGLVDARIPRRQARNAIRWHIAHRPSLKAPSLADQLLRFRPARQLFARYLHRQTRAKADPRHYPAPFALIDLWRDQTGDIDEDLAAEARSVARLITSDTARNLVRVFKLQERLKRHGDDGGEPVRHVHIVGAGLMGGDIAAWCALRELRVSIEDRATAALASTLQRAAKLMNKRLRDYPHLKTAAMDLLTPDPRGLGRARADLIIEAIIEDETAKQTLFRELETTARPDAILATNTSSIPLENIACSLDDPTRLVGLHFFNPVAKMPLVEVIHGPDSDPQAIARASAFARRIGKLPLPVKSAPGFLVNRVLTPYLLEAARLRAEGESIAAIDAAAKDFGMPMGPLELADAVGLDICLNVARELAGPLQLEIPAALEAMVAQGKLGKKSGEGFYVYRNGKKIKPSESAPPSPRLTQRLIGKLIDEAQRCLEEGIVASADEVDAGVIFGTGFAPFTGGPLRYRENNPR